MVRTTRGDIATDVVAICCGVWSPRIAKMAGARIPLTPIVHQMISVGPIALFDGTEGEIAYPIVRDVDENMYERQHGGDMEVGSYAHRPIIVAPGRHPVESRRRCCRRPRCHSPRTTSTRSWPRRSS